MNENDLIRIILGKETVKNRKSCLVLALQAARYNTGRNCAKGDIENITISEMQYEIMMRGLENKDSKVNEYSDSILISGLINYLILLDLIGILFQKKEYTAADKESSIKVALKNFSDYNEAKINAVRNLRNSLAHTYSIATEPKGKKGHKFTLCFDDCEQAIELPSNPWNCDYSDKRDCTSTKIHIAALCCEIENILKNVYTAFNKDLLEIRIKDTDQVLSQFTLIYE